MGSIESREASIQVSNEEMEKYVEGDRGKRADAEERNRGDDGIGVTSYGPKKRKEAALTSCAEHQLRLMRCYNDQNLPNRIARITRSMTAEMTQEEEKSMKQQDEFSAGCEFERKQFWECYYMKRHGGREPPRADLRTLIDVFSKPWFGRGQADDDKEKG